MEIQKQLEELGLRESEIRVYLYLLKQGVSTPPQVAKGTGIARPNCYKVLQSLKEKGLIEEQKKDKRKAYLASDPIALVQTLERRKEAMDKMLPDLRALYTTQKNKPEIRFYDGFEQVKQIYLQTLSAKEILGVASTEKLFDLSPKFFDKYRKEVKKRGIDFRDIVTYKSGEKSGPKAKKELRGFYELKLLPKRYEDIPTDILIWDDNVALIVIDKPVFGTVLTNKHMAQTFRILFDLSWQKLF